MSDNKHLDVRDKELSIGDIVIFSNGYNISIHVVRGFAESVLTVGVYRWNGVPSTYKENTRGNRSCVRKVSDAIIPELLDYDMELHEFLLQTRREILDGTFDKKKKK